MSNKITVGVEFYFKGQQFSPSVEIDLDRYLAQQDNFDAVYSLLASSNEIGIYSYEYEVMESTPLVYSNASGLAADFLQSGQFDLESFMFEQQKSQIMLVVDALLVEHVSDELLRDNAELKEAMLQAYKVGRQAAS